MIARARAKLIAARTKINIKNICPEFSGSNLENARKLSIAEFIINSIPINIKIEFFLVNAINNPITNRGTEINKKS